AVCLGYQRAHLDLRIVRQAYTDIVRGFTDGINESAINRLLDKESRTRHAALPRGAEDPGRNAGHRMLKIRIVEYDMGRFAPEFQPHRDEALAGHRCDGTSGLCATCERHHADARVLHECGSDRSEEHT